MRIAFFDPAFFSLRSAAKVAAIVLAAASLAACASSSGVSSKYAARHSSLIAAAGAKTHTVLTRPKNGVQKYGVASFYTEGTETANGEKIDPDALTAAHRSLPFGTMLKVTDVTTGRSVTVRVNDRGPFVQGRVVDLSYSAAAALGIVDQGITKVRLDIVR